MLSEENPTWIQEILQRLRSDRLWALLAFVALILVNSMFNLGLDVPGAAEETSALAMAGYSTIAFILGKSIRGTVGGSLFERGLEGGVAILETHLPDVQPDASEGPSTPK